MVRKRLKKPQRFIGRSGYYVAQDPLGRYVKVKKENKNFIPKDWNLIKGSTRFYDRKGNLNELTHGVIEITSRKHATWFTSIRNVNVGILFGKLYEKKTGFFKNTELLSTSST